MIKIVFAFITLLISTLLVDAYPDGAGGCAGGRAAVGGYHRNKLLGFRSITSRNLTAAGIELQIGGFKLEEGGSVNRLFNISHPITVNGVNGKKFLGFLIRVSSLFGADTAGVLTPDPAVAEIAKVCKAPVVGITHKSASAKTSAGGLINFPVVSPGILIDVTVVFKNKFSGSSFAYGSFTINFNNP